jgi:hypothetical protein
VAALLRKKVSRGSGTARHGSGIGRCGSGRRSKVTSGAVVGRRRAGDEVAGTALSIEFGDSGVFHTARGEFASKT